MTKKRRRPIHLHVMVSEAEQALIQERMAEAGIRNMGAYMQNLCGLLMGYLCNVIYRVLKKDELKRVILMIFLLTVSPG